MTSDLGLESFVEELLMHRFPGETFKHGVKRTAQGLRFHCPYCGDTYTVGATPRGNLYLKSGRYKCFNGGCGVSTSLSSFVKKWADEYSLTLEGINFDEIKLAETDNVVYNGLTISKDNSICDYLSDNGMYDGMVDIDKFKFVFGLVDIGNISQDSKVFKYLAGRCAFDIPDLYKRVYADFTDSRIYLMNVDDSKGKVLSYATRELDYKKYIIHPYSDILLHMNPDDQLEKVYIEFLDMISSYFNVLNVDFRKEVNIAEGQFDSMFLDNYMAIQGVSKSSFIVNHIEGENVNLFFDNDKAGITSTSSMLENCRSYGFIRWDDILSKLSSMSPSYAKAINKVHDINELYCTLKSILGVRLNVSDFNDIIHKYVRKFDNSRLSFNLI